MIGDDDNMELANVQTTTIPEPPTWALMALGFGLLGGAGYWTRRLNLRPRQKAIGMREWAHLG